MGGNGVTVGFAILAALTLATGIGVIVARNPVHSALWLVGNVVTLAVLYLTLHAEFMAAAQVIVYAGAIMVLFLFVVTLLTAGKEDAEPPEALAGQQGAAAFFGIATGILLAGAAVRFGALSVPGRTGPTFGSLAAMGRALWGSDFDYLALVALMLLTAALGVLVLNRPDRRGEQERGSGA
jgi:NADH-quinone oxidoreductase subunit J